MDGCSCPISRTGDNCEHIHGTCSNITTIKNVLVSEIRMALTSVVLFQLTCPV